MAYKFKDSEIRELCDLIGEEISIRGSCSAEVDEPGCTRSGLPLDIYQGKLVMLDYDSRCKELYSLSLNVKGKIQFVSLNTTASSQVWNIKRTIYYQGRIILSIPPNNKGAPKFSSTVDNIYDFLPNFGLKQRILGIIFWRHHTFYVNH